MRRLDESLLLDDTLCKSVRCLKVDLDRFIDLRSFKSLQILGIKVHIDDIPNAISYLASKFTPDHFKRMQIHLFSNHFDRQRISGQDEFRGIDPKHIRIDTTNVLKLEQIKMILDSINPSILSFNLITIRASSRDFEFLEIFSNIAQKVKIYF